MSFAAAFPNGNVNAGWHTGNIGLGFSPNNRALLDPHNPAALDANSFQALYGLAPYGKSDYWANRTHTNNHYTTSQELWRDQTISLWSALVTQALIYQSCYIILSIVAPFLYTYIQNFNYGVENMTVIPAQPTLPGVNARTGSHDRTEFSMTMREYGTMGMMPVSVLFDPMQNEQRRNMLILSMGFSLAAAFIQIVLIGFMMMGSMADYCCNLGYQIRETQELELDQVLATDRRLIGAANMGLTSFLHEIDIYLRALKYPRDGSRKRTYMLVTAPFIMSCTTQTNTDTIKEFKTYYGFLQDRTTQLASGITSGMKIYQIPSDAPALQVNTGTGNSITMITVPQIPISPPNIYLPSILEGYECINQFYHVPQRERDTHTVDGFTNSLGIYNQRKDDYVWINFSQMTAACGIWNPISGDFSSVYKGSVKSLNSGLSSYVPNIASGEEARHEILMATANHKDTLSNADGYKDEMPFTYFDGESQKTKLARNFHAISESTLPTSQAIFAASQLAKKYKEALGAIVSLVEFAKMLLDKVPSDECINWLIGKAKSDFWKAVGSQSDITSATPTSWRTPTTTHSSCQRDLGWLNLNGVEQAPTPASGSDEEKEKAAMLEGMVSGFGGGLAHQIHRLAGLAYSSNPVIAKLGKQASDIVTRVNELVGTEAVLMNSELFQRVPAWVSDQTETSIAIVSMLLSAIPAFVINNDEYASDGTPVPTPTDAANFTWLTSADLAKALAALVAAGDREPGDWVRPEYRAAIISWILGKGKDKGLKMDVSIYPKIDYIIATAKFTKVSDLSKLLESAGAKAFKYDNAPGRRLELASTFASLLEELSLILVSSRDERLNYDAVVGEIAAKSILEGKKISFLSHPFPDPRDHTKSISFAGTVEDIVKDNPDISKEFATKFKFILGELDNNNVFYQTTTVAGLQSKPNKVSFVRTPIVMSPQAWLKYYSAATKSPTTTTASASATSSSSKSSGTGSGPAAKSSSKLRLIPGDWRTGFATPLLRGDNQVMSFTEFSKHIADMSKYGNSVESLIYESAKDREKRKKAEEKQVEDGVGLTPAEDLPFMGSYAGRRYESVTASDIRRGHAPGSGGDTTQGDAFQGDFIKISSKLRFEDIYNHRIGQIPAAIRYMLLAYLHMPTNKHCVDALGNAGFWVPVDFLVVRSIVVGATSIVIAADGCHRAVIGPPSVVQVQNSVNDEWRIKASARFGILPNYMGGCYVARGTLINRCLYGLSTEFIANPGKHRPKLSPTGTSSNDPCLLALAIPTTFSMGHHFSWTEKHMHESIRNLSRLQDAKETRKMPKVFSTFYANWINFYGKMIEKGGDLRMAQIRKLFVGGKFTITMQDQGTWLRKFAMAATCHDQFILGPCATYFHGKLSSHRGYGPLGEIRTQAKGAANVYMGKHPFFPTADEPRLVGIPAN